MTPEERREYNRLWKRKYELRKWAAKAMRSRKCPAHLTRGLPCRATLENRLVRGATVPFCPQCDRKRRGVCIACQKAPVAGTVGRSIYCLTCGKLQRHATSRRWRNRNPEKVKGWWASQREKMHADAELRAKRLERKRAWARLNPRKRREWTKRWAASANGRAYQARYRESHKETALERRRRLASGQKLTHPCAECRTPLAGRKKKCDACKAREYVAARRLIIAA